MQIHGWSWPSHKHCQPIMMRRHHLLHPRPSHLSHPHLHAFHRSPLSASLPHPLSPPPSHVPAANTPHSLSRICHHWISDAKLEEAWRRRRSRGSTQLHNTNSPTMNQCSLHHTSSTSYIRLHLGVQTVPAAVAVVAVMRNSFSSSIKSIQPIPHQPVETSAWIVIIHLAHGSFTSPVYTTLVNT